MNPSAWWRLRLAGSLLMIYFSYYPTYKMLRRLMQAIFGTHSYGYSRTLIGHSLQPLLFRKDSVDKRKLDSHGAGVL